MSNANLSLSQTWLISKQHHLPHGNRPTNQNAETTWFMLKKKILYPSEMWFNITISLLLDGRNSSFDFFGKSPTMDISPLCWAFEPHGHATRTLKTRRVSDHMVNGPSTLQKSTSWWAGDHLNVWTGVPGAGVHTGVTRASLRGGHWEGLSKEWALSPVTCQLTPSYQLSLFSNFGNCPQQLVPFIVLHHKIPQMKYSSGHTHP